MRKQRKESEEASSHRRDDVTRRHASIAVEIPPPRRYHLRSPRSTPEHITSDDSQSESSLDNDDSNDEDFTKYSGTISFRY
jgi:hypothetical protein